MRWKALLLAGAAALALSSSPGESSACGGCFVQQSESTQVSGHRMLLSISNTQTTLWDQIVYAGAPESFVWVLPIKGVVEVGLSSDALFQSLETKTQVIVHSPAFSCPGPGGCSSTGGGFGTDVVEDESPVEVLAHEVVGPYETVQLSSQDPAALKSWLIGNGYDIPADIAPIIDAYVNEGFDFLALKLVPGENIKAMRPVRVTSPGASPVLPLRMVAAGTGAITPITLLVMGEGNWVPSNFDWYYVLESALFWDFETSSSNYKTIVQDFFAEYGDAWLTEMSEPFGAAAFSAELLALAQQTPVESGYGDAMGQGAVESCQADLEDLFGTLDMTSVTVTRMTAQLARPALASDLQLAASTEQWVLPRDLYVPEESYTGEPDCPPSSSGSCGSGSGSGSANSSSSSSGSAGGAGGGGEGGGGEGGAAPDPGESGGCAVTAGSATGGALGALGLSLVLSIVRRRRKEVAS